MAWLLPPAHDIGTLRGPVRSSLGLLGVFVVVLLAAGLVERVGVEGDWLPLLVIGSCFALFALVALLSHARRPADYYAVDRSIPAPFGGATAASAFAGLIAIGLAGGAYLSLPAFLVSVAGLLLGFLLLALLIAPGVRRFGAYGASDFLAARFGGFWARIAAAAVAFASSLLILVAQIKVAAPLIATLTGLTPEAALYASAALTAIALLPGGMRSLTWTQAIQYLVIAIACLAPAALLALGDGPMGGAPAPDLGGLLLFDVWTSDSGREGWLPVLALALGVASLPHLHARAASAASGVAAGLSMLWAVLFSLALAMAGLVLAQLLAAALGRPAAGVSGGLLDLAALFSALPVTFAALVLAGLLAALLAIGQAALFSATAAFSHDFFDEVVDRRGPEGRRILIARLLTAAIAAGAAGLAFVWPADPNALVAWGLAFAACGTFAPLVLGLWWRRCNEIGAMAGTLAGFGFAALVFVLEQGLIPGWSEADGWGGIGAPTATILGVAASLVFTAGVSLMTPAPDADVQKLMDQMKSRRGVPMRERPA